MKHLVIHKVFSVALSFLVLASTLSLTIEKHFCGGILVDVAVFTEVKKCGDTVTNTDSAEVLKKSCCKDEIDVFNGLNKMTTNSFEDLENIQKKILFAYIVSYINLLEYEPNLAILNKEYSSPILIKDIQVLDETYLI